MRRFLSILALAAGLASAATFEVRNRQECYVLPEDSQGECLSAVRAGRTYSAQIDSVPRQSSNQANTNAPRKSSLEERSVIAQEESAKAQASLASAQHSVANALWTMVITGFAVMAISLIVATTH